jgi:hypothetical protein
MLLPYIVTEEAYGILREERVGMLGRGAWEKNLRDKVLLNDCIKRALHVRVY